MIANGPMKYLVTGASGYIGDEVCKVYSENQIEVQALYRYSRPQARPFVSPVCCNLFQEQALKRVLTNVDVIIHLAWQGGLSGSKGLAENDEDNFVNLKMIRSLLRVAEESNVERFVFVSAVGASKTAHSNFLREKYLCELELFNSKIPEKIILRSGIVYDGKLGSDRFLQTVTGLMAFPLFYPLPQAEQRVSTIYLGDLAKICMEAAGHELLTESALLEVCENHSYSMEAICRLAAQRFVPGRKYAIRGAVAAPLVKFIESRRKAPKERETFSDYLVFNQEQDGDFNQDNPLKSIIPTELRTFAEILAKQN